MQSSKISDYDVMSIIGTGSFGTCYKVKNKLSGDIYVWKSIDYNNLAEDKKYLIINEINLLRELKHPNIVQYYDHINHAETKTIFIIMECCEGGDLSKLIQRCKLNQLIFEEAFIWRVLYQTSKALQYCHLFKERKCIILHRDIKPANIFLDTSGTVKLGDFGVARILTESDNFETETVVGTPHYMSPEITKGVKYNKKSDIWSLGCLIYEMCALTPPFLGKRYNELFENINSGIFARIPTIYSDDLNQIIKFMLTVDNDIRPSIECILHHPKVIINQTGSNTGYPKLVSNQMFVNDDPKINFTSTQLKRNVEPIMDSDFSFDIKSTPELKKELFQSARRKIFENNSDSEFHRSHTSNRLPKKPFSLSDNLQKLQITRDPDEITQEIFNEALRKRLQTIRAHESLIKQKEDDLKMRENQLIVREKKILHQNDRLRRSRKNLRKSSSHHKLPITDRADDTNATIEPNDTIILPTVARLDLHKLQRPKTLPLNRVKFNINQNQENIPPHSDRVSQSQTTSSSSYSTNFNNQLKYNYRDLEEAVNKKFAKQVTNKRRSIFSLLFSSSNANTCGGKTVKKANSVESIISVPANSIAASSTHKTNAAADGYDFNSKWTSETKKTAFEMLALLNGGENRNDDSKEIIMLDDKIIKRDNKRKSMIVYKKHTNL